MPLLYYDSQVCNTSLDFPLDFQILTFKIPRYLFLAAALSSQVNSWASPAPASPIPHTPLPGLPCTLYSGGCCHSPNHPTQNPGSHPRFYLYSWILSLSCTNLLLKYFSKPHSALFPHRPAAIEAWALSPTRTTALVSGIPAFMPSGLQIDDCLSTQLPDHLSYFFRSHNFIF